MPISKMPNRFQLEGGFNRPVKVGEFISQAMSGGGITYANALYKAYKEYVEDIPYNSKYKQGVKRRCMNYSSFRLYLYWARRLGLIEYTNPDGSAPTDKVIGEPSSIPGLSDKLYFKMVDGEGGNPAWSDLYGYYKGSR